MFGSLPFKAVRLVLFVLLASSFLSILASASLRIKQDQEAKKKGLYIWSSVATFDKDNTEISNEAEFYGIAMQAYQEMMADWDVQKTPGYRQPAVIAAMGIGQETYLSSSINGGSFVYQENGANRPVNLALQSCRQGLEEKYPDTEIKEKHKTKASCAEVMAVHQYYTDPNQPSLSNTRIVAFGLQLNHDTQQYELKPKRPCGGLNKNAPDHTTWVCKQFMAFESITTLRKNRASDQESAHHAEKYQASGNLLNPGRSHSRLSNVDC